MVRFRSMEELPLETPGWLQRGWLLFCRGLVRAHYRRVEVKGLENLPPRGPLLVAANHGNGLADPILLQAVSPRPLHPLARSTLFRNPLAWPFLKVIQAVPIYRRVDAQAQMDRNADSFRRCYELSDRGGVVLIFPEGVTHHNPKLMPFKAGAARLILGYRQARGLPLAVVPAGLFYADKGRYRSDVLVSFGTPFYPEQAAVETEEEAAARITADLQRRLEAMVPGADSWEELALFRRMERLFALRRGRYRVRSLESRVRKIQALLHTHGLVARHHPERLEAFQGELARFDELCGLWGVKDYHLNFEYTPLTVAGFLTRAFFRLTLAVPLALWGLVNSLAPFVLVRLIAPWVSRDAYQLDVAKMSLGMFFFGLFWGTQTWWVAQQAGGWPALGYLLSLPPATTLAVFLAGERRRTWVNIRVFLLFLRKRRLRGYLRTQRDSLEKELGQLTRLAIRLSAQQRNA
ncbi:MAG: lysophospholipid acyltransferase family protein [Deltaproteobacteria bacterium]|nr:lysophospholipid acyltransferase family protein [Deltaproteobacteria bacterium]